MSTSTKDFVIRVVAVGAVLFLLVAGGLYAQALFEGRAVFPVELQSAIVGALVVIIGMLGPATAAWISTRASNRNAAQTQAVVQQEAEGIKEFHKNGGGDALATKLLERVEPVIREGDRRNDAPNDTGDRRRVSDTEDLERR